MRDSRAVEQHRMRNLGSSSTSRRHRATVADIDEEGDEIELSDSKGVNGQADLGAPDEYHLEGYVDSPFAEVRAAVPPFDEPSMPCNTLRVWVLGLTFATIGSGINTLFALRAPSISITIVVTLLISYWTGKAWTRVIPTTWSIFGSKVNPGPFNIKEHTVIVIMSNVSFGSAYATWIIVTQRQYYAAEFGRLYEILLVWTSQLVGYGIAGMMRRFLVWPASMIWPVVLVNAVLFHTFHGDHELPVPGWSMSRFKFFLIILTASFIWAWVPQYLAPALSVTAFVTWLKPNHVVVNQLFGGFTGLSILPLTFDWSQVSGYLGSPLAWPWEGILNTFAGTLVIFIFGGAIISFTGTWYADYLPMSDSASYDNTQSIYNVSRVLNSEFRLDVEAYKSYSPLFLSTTFALGYGTSFAALSSVIMHTFLYHGTDIWTRFKGLKSGDEDIHLRLYRRYPEVPDYWYYLLFSVTTALAMVVTQVWETRLEWWALMFALMMASVLFLPVGILAALTNLELGLNVISEFVIGYIQPGNPMAMMLFKTYGYVTATQALSFVADLKLGLYMKIPPKTLFWTQIVATAWASLVEVGIMNWGLSNIEGVCTQEATNSFTCPNARTFYTASVIWGVLGPARTFSSGQIYGSMMWFFLIGILLPVPFWLLYRWRPNSWVRLVNIPVFFGAVQDIPPATPLNYLSFCVVGYLFQYRVRRWYPHWWGNYNYVLSCALDSGFALAVIVIFLALGFTNVNGGSFLSWWGTDVVGSTTDAQGTAIRKVLKPGETFGPPAGSWS